MFITVSPSSLPLDVVTSSQYLWSLVRDICCLEEKFYLETNSWIFSANVALKPLPAFSLSLSNCAAIYFHIYRPRNVQTVCLLQTHKICQLSGTTEFTSFHPVFTFKPTNARTCWYQIFKAGTWASPVVPKVRSTGRRNPCSCWWFSQKLPKETSQYNLRNVLIKIKVYKCL